MLESLFHCVLMMSVLLGIFVGSASGQSMQPRGTVDLARDLNCHDITILRDKSVIRLYIRQRHADVANLANASYLRELLAQAGKIANEQCAKRPPPRRIPPGGSGGINVKVINSDRAGLFELSAWLRPGNSTWDIEYNRVIERAEATRKKEELRTVAAERRQAALSDCGHVPTVSGGPWFSSTYKTAVLDAAKRATSSAFLCVKTIEYMSAAPNPFGGNAARVRLIGYSSMTYEKYSEVGDVAY